MMQRWVWLVPICASMACNGVIAEPSGSGGAAGERGGDSAGPGGSGAGELSCEGLCVGASGMQRLTRAQYRGAVRAVLGDGIAVDVAGLPRDHAAGPFSSNGGVPISERDVEMYATMADGIAAQAARDLETLLPCDAAADGDLACARALVAELGPRLYRRPLTEDETAAYDSLVAWALEEGDLADAASLVIATMLQSPSFLYRIEPAATEPTPLDPWSLASRLSFYLWQEGPDDTLWRAASAGELGTPEALVAQARRMLDDPRADRTIRAFHREWLGVSEIDQIGRTDPAFTDAIAADMRNETELFAVRVLREDDARLSTLLTHRRSVLTPLLADHYGVTHPTGTGTEVVDVPERPGILTTGAVLVAHASETFTRPVHRGVFVRKNVLCDPLPPPDPSALAMAEEAAAELPETLTDRERLAALTEGPGCYACHSLTNPIGYAFERFDALGRFRDTDAEGRPIDTTGELSGTGNYETDVDGPFDGADDFTARLGESDTVARCVTTQWLRYALGREEEDEDAASIDAAHAVFRESGYDIRELVIAVVATDAFRYRAAPPE